VKSGKLVVIVGAQKRKRSLFGMSEEVSMEYQREMTALKTDNFKIMIPCKPRKVKVLTSILRTQEVRNITLG